MDLNHIFYDSILSIVVCDEVWCVKICLGIQIIFTNTLPLCRGLLLYLCLRTQLFLDRKIINISVFLQSFPLLCEQDSSCKHFL